MTIKEFLILAEVASNTDEVLSNMKSLGKPEYVGGRKVPGDLNGITMGQLAELQNLSSVFDCVYNPCSVLFGMDTKEVSGCEVREVLALAVWVAKEVERISKLFASTSVPPTPEETQAGVKELSFGMFGLMDYYALRMGITDHAEVERVPWVRVYKCMEMDAAKIRYERRLREIYSKKKL